MADFGKINEFRKTTELRKINEDPTYLSFFFLFNFYDRERSPLLSGAAEDYLRNVVVDTTRADLLARFVKLLRKINTELPWFWQSISGFEATKKYNKMADPWWGADSPKIEIECLENVELTAATLIDLYKRAAYDFNRWVEIIPKNLRHFEMTVFVTEIRTFQQSSNDSLLNSKNKNTSDLASTEELTNYSIKADMSIDAKPIFVTKLGYCEFDIESTSDTFANLTKNPEMATSKIMIDWLKSDQIRQVYGYNLNANQENSLVLERAIGAVEEENNPFDPLAYAKGAVQRKLDDIKDTFEANANNLIAGFPGNEGPLGNAHGQLLTGLAGQTAQSLGEAITGRLLLSNVYGINAASTVQDAINAGSLNGIRNAAGQLFNRSQDNPGGRDITPKRVYPEVVANTISLPINERIHEPGTDSSPDGNINQNVHE